jgi:RNA polymerase sigma factor (sigma-70 family)
MLSPGINLSPSVPLPLRKGESSARFETRLGVSRQSALFARELEALGEAIFAGDTEDASRRLNFFKARLARLLPDETETFWQDVAKAAPSPLTERTEKGLLEAAIKSPAIPWKETDLHLLFLARAIQDGDFPKMDQEKRYFLGLFETAQPLYQDAGFERAYHLVNAFSGRLDWDTPYAPKERVNQAVIFALERLAGAMSRYLAGHPQEDDPTRESLKEFFQLLSQEQRLMYSSPVRIVGHAVTGDDLTEQEKQYLGGNIVFYRQMIGNGTLTIFGNIVLGTLALLKDEQARNRLLTSQYRNIRSLARKYDTPGLDRIDLIQTAWIGLQKALEVYEPWQGTLFWILAKKWVFGAIILEFKKTLRFIRTMEPVEENDGQSYQEALESLITRRGLLPGDGTESTEFTHKEAGQFIEFLMPLLDSHDQAILMAWLKEPNIVTVADQFGTSKQNISNALARIQATGRQLAHERHMMPQSTWEKFRRAELATQTGRLRDYAEKKAGQKGTRLKLRTSRSFLMPQAKPSSRLRPLLAAEKAGLLAIAESHFEEDKEGETKAIRHYQEVFLSGREDNLRYYIYDLGQRIDFDSGSLKDQFFNLAILQLFQTLSWKFKTPGLADHVCKATESKILAAKEPPYTDVLLAARRFLETFPDRCKTPEVEKNIDEALLELPV